MGPAASVSQVPLEPRENARHDNTAQGIAHVTLLVSSEDDLAAATAQLTAVVGAHPSRKTVEDAAWGLDSQPEHVMPGQPAAIAELRVRVAKDDDEREYVGKHGAGIFEVGFVVADPNQARGGKTPYGKVVWIAAA